MKVWTSTFLVILMLGQRAEAFCVNWALKGQFADIEATDIIFEGTVQRVEPDTRSKCAPDRVVFSVLRVWKGGQSSERVLLQDTTRTHWEFSNWEFKVVGCPQWSEQDTFSKGVTYIVFANGSPKGLRSAGCGLSSPATVVARKRLEDWATKQPRSN